MKSQVYYNDNDPKACAWLRELIREGHIPNGHIDQRSIADVQPADLAGYIQCHFFAGIGGWPLALRLAGWPDDRPVWTLSCPCQPFSCAGQGKGTRDKRHLWPQAHRLLKACQPPIAFGEQVASAAGRLWLARIRTNMEKLAYEIGAADLCAASLGAPHIRQRLWWVANSRSQLARRGIPGRSQGIAKSRQPSNQFGGSGGARRLGDSENERSKVRPQLHAGDDGQGSGQGCESGRLADADGSQSRHAELQRSGGLVQQSPDEDSVRLADAQHNGRRTDQPGRKTERRIADGNGSWSDFDLIPCADGKARRIESGTFPLAHGVPGRVGLLRGYGNAIAPQLASQFIQAALEALDL